MMTETQVWRFLEELAVREDVPGDVRERAAELAEAGRPSPEMLALLALFDDVEQGRARIPSRGPSGGLGGD